MTTPYTFHFEDVAALRSKLEAIANLADALSALDTHHIVTVSIAPVAQVAKVVAPENGIGHVPDFTQAVPRVRALAAPEEKMTPFRGTTLDESLAELESGQRRSLNGFRRDKVQMILSTELRRIYALLGRTYTQMEWDQHKKDWATAGVAVPRSMGITWWAIQTALDAGSL
jgi:hypothetical protein